MQGYTIVTAAAASADADYNGLDAADVSVTTPTTTPRASRRPDLRADDDRGAAARATFTVVLTSQPTADVTIALSSSGSTEGTVSAAPLTFTTVNWNVAQTVTVTGVDDAPRRRGHRLHHRHRRRRQRRRRATTGWTRPT